MNTNQKGAIAESKVIADLSEKGYRIAIPLGDGPFDLIAIDDNFHLYKVQVKHCTMNKSGTVTVRPYYITTYHGKRVQQLYADGSVDIMAVYVPDNDKCYYLNYGEIPEGGIQLRIFPALNNQIAGINMALEYEKFPARA